MTRYEVGARLAVEDGRASAETVLCRTMRDVSADWLAVGFTSYRTASTSIIIIIIIITIIIIISSSSSSVEQITAPWRAVSLPDAVHRPWLCGTYLPHVLKQPGLLSLSSLKIYLSQKVIIIKTTVIYIQPWARAVRTLPAVPRSTQLSTLRVMVNEYRLLGWVIIINSDGGRRW